MHRPQNQRDMTAKSSTYRHTLMYDARDESNEPPATQSENNSVSKRCSTAAKEIFSITPDILPPMGIPVCWVIIRSPKRKCLILKTRLRAPEVYQLRSLFPLRRVFDYLKKFPIQMIMLLVALHNLDEWGRQLSSLRPCHAYQSHKKSTQSSVVIWGLGSRTSGPDGLLGLLNRLNGLFGGTNTYLDARLRLSGLLSYGRRMSTQPMRQRGFRRRICADWFSLLLFSTPNLWIMSGQQPAWMSGLMERS